MEKANLPRGILSCLDKLCQSLFINVIFFTRRLLPVFFIDVETGQICLELSAFCGNDDKIFFLM